MNDIIKSPDTSNNDSSVINSSNTSSEWISANKSPLSESCNNTASSPSSSGSEDYNETSLMLSTATSEILSSNVKSYFGAIVRHHQTQNQEQQHQLTNNLLFSEDDYYSDLDSAKIFNSPQTTILTSLSNQTTPSPFVMQVRTQNTNQTNIDCSNQRNHIESSEESEIEMNIKIESRLAGEPNKKPEAKSPFVKRTAIIEVRPEYSTAAMISLNSPPMSASPSSSSASSVIDETEIIKRQQYTPPGMIQPEKEQKQQSMVTINLVRRDSGSQHPMFPALGENELNEQHVNFMVKRTGEIIEKNGVYFSHDGSVRGYPGIVKKFAQSRTLKEIFTKQQELEKQRETLVEDQERQLKHQKLEKQRLNSEKVEKLPPTQNIFNANKSKIITTPAAVAFKTKNLTTIRKYTSEAQLNSSGKSSLDDELSRKLETRRQAIQSQLESASKNPNSTDTTFNPSIVTLTPSFNSNVTILSNKQEEPGKQAQKPGATTFNLKPVQQPEMMIVSKPVVNNSKNRLSIDVAPPLMTHAAALQPKPLAKPPVSSSFVMSAKSKIDNVYNNRNSLLNELKSVVPMIGAVDDDASSNDPHEQLHSPPLPPPPPMSQLEFQEQSFQSSATVAPPPPPPPPMAVEAPTTVNSTFNCFRLKQTDLLGQQPYKPQSGNNVIKPVVAPKNFSANTKNSLNSRNQVVDMRNDLLQSIKSFQFSSLKRASNPV